MNIKSLRILFAGWIILCISTCESFVVQANDSNTNLEDFQSAWQRVELVYPLLKEKNLDWGNVYQTYRPRAENARGDEIYQILNDLLKELRDPHIYFQTDGGGLVYPYKSYRMMRDRDAYSPELVRGYVNEELRLAGQEKMEYCILQDNIGYLYISTFEHDFLMEDLNEVMSYFEKTDGLIIDVRNNDGGETFNMRMITSRFLESPMDFLPGTLKGGVPYPEPPFEPDNSQYRYSADIVVLINGATFSMGELFTEAMKQLPNVTIVGDTTAGGGNSGFSGTSLSKEYYLPSGKLIIVPTTTTARYDGVPIEWNGIPPDIRITQTSDDVELGMDKQFDYAIELLTP